jgi:RNA polymerase sigma factor (sigma-70 family)
MGEQSDPGRQRASDSLQPEDSNVLLERARAGESSALSALFDRHAHYLRGWGHRKLPAWARRCADTADLVQDTLLQTLKRLPFFQPRGSGAMRAYLRQALMNRIRDELRRVAASGVGVDIAELPLSDGAPSPYSRAEHEERMRRYRRALKGLRPEERRLIVARFHLGYSHEQIALAFGKSSVDAARMSVRRAVDHLTAMMDRDDAC